eukprot:gene16202-22365_t
MIFSAEEARFMLNHQEGSKKAVLVCKKSHSLYVAPVYRPSRQQQTTSGTPCPPLFPITLWDSSYAQVQVPESPVCVLMVIYSDMPKSAPDAEAGYVTKKPDPDTDSDEDTGLTLAIMKSYMIGVYNTRYPSENPAGNPGNSSHHDSQKTDVRPKSSSQSGGSHARPNPAPMCPPATVETDDDPARPPVPTSVIEIFDQLRTQARTVYYGFDGSDLRDPHEYLEHHEWATMPDLVDPDKSQYRMPSWGDAAYCTSRSSTLCTAGPLPL